MGIGYYQNPHGMVPKNTLEQWKTKIDSLLNVKEVSVEEGTKFEIVLRCDCEEQFCTEDACLILNTTSVAEASVYAEMIFSNHTVLEIKRII